MRVPEYWLTELTDDMPPKNADDFKRILQAVTRPDQNQWGIASTGASSFSLTPNSAYSAIWRVPNNWRLDSSGKLTKDVETDEFKGGCWILARHLAGRAVASQYAELRRDVQRRLHCRPVCLWPGRLGPVRPTVGYRSSSESQRTPVSDEAIRGGRREALLPGGLRLPFVAPRATVHNS